MTHAQFLAWEAWQLKEWNVPDRHDYYAMRVAQSMGGGSLDKYRVKFQQPEPIDDLSNLSDEEIKRRADIVSRKAQMANAAALGMTMPDASIKGQQVASYTDSSQRDDTARQNGNNRNGHSDSGGNDNSEPPERVPNQWQRP